MMIDKSGNKKIIDCEYPPEGRGEPGLKDQANKDAYKENMKRDADISMNSFQFDIINEEEKKTDRELEIFRQGLLEIFQLQAQDDWGKPITRNLMAETLLTNKLIRRLGIQI
jgi:hypothetical protein